jgi:hypothetical protein
MMIEMSEENSKRVLSGTKWLTNASQNYFMSLNNDSSKPTSSVKKIVNAVLLVPIIVPTAVTALSFGFTILFFNAISAQKDDSALSKVAKGIAKLLIYIIAAAILIPCIITNLVISFIPFLIFRAINKNIFNQKGSDIESSQSKKANEVKIDNNTDYNKRVEEEVDKLRQQNNEKQDQDELGNDSQNNPEQHHSASNQALVRYNQPDVEIISRVSEDEKTIDQTVIASRINNDDIQGGTTIIRTVVDDCSVGINGIMTGDLRGKEKGFAAGFNFQSETIKKDGKVKGVDFNFGISIRTESNQREATQALMQSKPAHIILPGESGTLSIEHTGNSQRR